MNGFPTNWATTSLGELIELKYGKALPDRERSGDGFPVFGSNGVVGHHKTALTTGPTVVIGRKGSVGEVNFSQTPCSPIDTTYYVDSFPGSQSKYWYYKLRSLPLKELNKSTAIPGVSRSDVYPLEIAVPPLPEQKRIADKLDSMLARVNACRDRLDRLPALLKRFRQSILAAATSGRLTEDWRHDHANDASSGNLACLLNIQEKKRQWLTLNGTHNEASRVKKRLESFRAEFIENKELPCSWCWAPLEDASLMVVDCHNKTAPYESDGIPLVRTTNIRDGRFVWDDLRYVSEGTYRFWSKRCFPQPGDIVFTREAPMGEASIIPKNTKICLGQRTMLIRPLSEHTSESYLLLALLDPKFKERANKTAVGTGVKHLRVGDVSELKLPLPPTIEQTEIVRRVELLFAFADRLEARLANARRQVGQLTPALLAKAFRGELVAQDPADEPAAELLKRLAAQRATAPKAKRGRSPA